MPRARDEQWLADVRRAGPNGVTFLHLLPAPATARTAGLADIMQDATDTTQFTPGCAAYAGYTDLRFANMTAVRAYAAAAGARSFSYTPDGDPAADAADIEPGCMALADFPAFFRAKGGKNVYVYGSASRVGQIIATAAAAGISRGQYKIVSAHYIGPHICFPAGTPVITERGVVSIETIRNGDLVLTHKNRWQPVVCTMQRDAEVLEDRWLSATADHPFWASDAQPYRYPGNVRLPWELSRPGWVPAKDLEGKYLSIPRAVESLPIPDIGIPVKQDEAFWYMTGRWLGDGWTAIVSNPRQAPPRDPYRREPGTCARCGDIAAPSDRHPGLWRKYCGDECSKKAKSESLRGTSRTRNRIEICCGKHEAAELGEKLAATGLNWYKHENRTTFVFSTSCKELAAWLKTNFGARAEGKTLPGWLFGAPEQVREALLRGYLEADGHREPDGTWSAVTVSRNLATGMRVLATTLGYDTRLARKTRPATSVIEGRTVNQRTAWSLTIRERNGHRTRQDADHHWVRQVRPMKSAGIQAVYNITVAEDHSYTAHGYVVSNCGPGSCGFPQADATQFTDAYLGRVLDATQLGPAFFGDLMTASPWPLQSGDSGPAVVTLQERLNAWLRPSPLLAPDGDFGPATLAAVKAALTFWHYQQAGIAAGIVDESLWNHLIAPVPAAAPPEAKVITAVMISYSDGTHTVVSP
jgi:Hint domain